MRNRIPWMLLFGLGAGLLLVPAVRRRLERRAGGRRPRLPEVIRGTVPPEASERPVASAAPDLIPERVFRAVPSPRHPDVPGRARFEPVVPDAPERRDPAAEPAPVDSTAGRAEPVPPTLRKRS
jgi:hypothetical protein